MADRYRDRPPHHKTRRVRNQSSRRGAPVQAVAVHSTESQDVPGWDDLNGVGNWFDNPQSQASSHIGVDGEGHSVEWVAGSEKAWTILELNPVTVNIEFVGRAAQKKKDWETAQLKTAAKWTAYWCLRYGIPAQVGRVKNVNGFPVITKKGIIRHSDLTDAGFGTHTDPGKNFPMDEFLGYVKYYKAKGWTLGISD